MARDNRNKPSGRGRGQRQVRPQRPAERRSGGRQQPQRPQRKGIAGLFDRMRRFFGDLRGELKRVVWPSRNKLVQSATVVFAVLIAAAILIGIVDFIVRQSLIVAGFDIPREPLATQVATPTPTPTESVQVTEPVDSSESVEQTEPTDSEAASEGTTSNTDAE